jgi:hypothetical protein
MEERRVAYMILAGKLCTLRRRWEDNIKMDHHEVGGGSGKRQEASSFKSGNEISLP